MKVEKASVELHSSFQIQINRFAPTATNIVYALHNSPPLPPDPSIFYSILVPSIKMPFALAPKSSEFHGSFVFWVKKFLLNVLQNYCWFFYLSSSGLVILTSGSTFWMPSNRRPGLNSCSFYYSCPASYSIHKHCESEAPVSSRNWKILDDDYLCVFQTLRLSQIVVLSIQAHPLLSHPDPSAASHLTPFRPCLL